MEFFFLDTKSTTWGFIFLGFRYDDCLKTRALLGISGDSGAGTVWIDILFFTFKF